MVSTWDHPLPFIENINGTLTVNQTTAEYLEAIEKPMVVVCIAGLYRTGKSYLMNRLAGKSSGFSLGPTVESHTKGIWVWNVDHPYDSEKTILLMDTEGLGDAFKGDKTYDIWICCLAVLLSSVFVYNIIGRIETQVIDELIFVTEMSKHIRAKTSSSCDIEFDEFFPNFILAIRDFFLVPNIRGKAVTADEYMEEMMLSMRQSTKDLDIKRNKIKKKIRTYFKNRKCFFFARPTYNDEDLRHVDELPDENLQKDFLDCSNEFCKHIYSTGSVKRLDPRQAVIGRIFTKLAQLYVDAIRSGVVPCIETAVTQIAHNENSHALKESCEAYMKKMRERLSFPVTNEQLMLEHEKCYKFAVDIFHKRVFLDKGEEYHNKLQDQLNKQFIEFQKENSIESSKKCKAILEKLFMIVDEKVHSAKYITPGGYQQYQDDISKIKKQYNSIPDKGIMADAVICEVLKQRETERESILHADKNLSEQEKIIQAEKLKIEKSKQEAEIQRQNLETIRNQEESIRKAHEEHLKSLTETFEKQMKLQEEKYKQLLHDRQEEMERLIRENFDKDARQLEEQINNLNQERQSYPRRIFGSLASLGGLALTLVPHPVVKGAGLALSFLSGLFR